MIVGVGTNAATVDDGDPHADPPMSERVPTSLTFHELAEAHLDFVFRCLQRLGLDEATVDDVTQEVFLIASRKLDAIEQGKERGFLYLTAKNVAGQYRQRAARRSEVEFEEEADPEHTMLATHDQPSLDELLDKRRARLLLEHVLDSMPEKLREVFVLSELEELSAPDVASCLDIPVGTAASRLRRARKAFDLTLTRLRTRADFSRGTR